MLIDVEFFEKRNNSTVQQAFINCCQLLWPVKVEYEKVLLLVTDQASYMVLAAKNLKTFSPSLNHITCIAHALNRVCSAIQENLNKVNRFVLSMKKVMLNSKSKQSSYRELTRLKLPPDPVVTRWCTWLEAANYYRENFNSVKKLIDSLKLESKSQSIQKVKKLINEKSFHDQFLSVKDYKFLIEIITKLQEQNMKLTDQMALLEETKLKLSGFAKEKLVKILMKNRDLKKFCDNQDFEHRSKTEYVPLVSVDVERSFSQYKNILTDNRQRLLPDNLKMNIIIQFNSFLKK
jgi:hypothetical protein